MKQWILRSYIQPSSKSYDFLYFIQRHLLVCVGLSCLLIIAYPSIEYGRYLFTQPQQQQLKVQLTEQLEQETARLHALKQRIQKQSEESPQFHQVNQKIEQVLLRHQLKTEQFQWQLEQENKLYLELIQQSHILFAALNELAQIEHFYATEITFTKLHQQRLVQLSGSFLLLD